MTYLDQSPNDIILIIVLHLKRSERHALFYNNIIQLNQISIIHLIRDEYPSIYDSMNKIKILNLITIRTYNYINTMYDNWHLGTEYRQDDFLIDSISLIGDILVVDDYIIDEPIAIMLLYEGGNHIYNNVINISILKNNIVKFVNDLYHIVGIHFRHVSFDGNDKFYNTLKYKYLLSRNIHLNNYNNLDDINFLLRNYPFKLIHNNLVYYLFLLFLMNIYKDYEGHDSTVIESINNNLKSLGKEYYESSKEYK